MSHFVGRALRLITSEADCYPIPGARVSVPLNDRTGRLMWTGCYELELVTFLQAMLGPGSTRRLRGVRYGMADHGCGFCSGSSGDREALSVALEEVLSDGLLSLQALRKQAPRAVASFSLERDRVPLRRYPGEARRNIKRKDYCRYDSGYTSEVSASRWIQSS